MDVDDRLRRMGERSRDAERAHSLDVVALLQRATPQRPKGHRTFGRRRLVTVAVAVMIPVLVIAGLLAYLAVRTPETSMPTATVDSSPAGLNPAGTMPTSWRLASVATGGTTHDVSAVGATLQFNGAGKALFGDSVNYGQANYAANDSQFLFFEASQTLALYAGSPDDPRVLAQGGLGDVTLSRAPAAWTVDANGRLVLRTARYTLVWNRDNAAFPSFGPAPATDPSAPLPPSLADTTAHAFSLARLTSAAADGSDVSASGISVSFDGRGTVTWRSGGSTATARYSATFGDVTFTDAQDNGFSRSSEAAAAAYAVLTTGVAVGWDVAETLADGQPADAKPVVVTRLTLHTARSTLVCDLAASSK